MVVTVRNYGYLIQKKKKKQNLQKQQNVIKNNIYNNIIIALIYGEDLEKIIKIQSNVRGMEMREKIKLKSKKRKLNNQKLNKTNEDNTKTTDFIYDKKISKKNMKK